MNPLTRMTSSSVFSVLLICVSALATPAEASPITLTPSGVNVDGIGVDQSGDPLFFTGTLTGRVDVDSVAHTVLAYNVKANFERGAWSEIYWSDTRPTQPGLGNTALLNFVNGGWQLFLQNWLDFGTDNESRPNSVSLRLNFDPVGDVQRTSYWEELGGPDRDTQRYGNVFGGQVSGAGRLVVPEPSTMALVALACLALVAQRRRARPKRHALNRGS